MMTIVCIISITVISTTSISITITNTIAVTTITTTTTITTITTIIVTIVIMITIQGHGSQGAAALQGVADRSLRGGYAAASITILSTPNSHYKIQVFSDQTLGKS